VQFFAMYNVMFARPRGYACSGKLID